MKIHKIELLIIDNEEYGVGEFVTLIEQSRYLSGAQVIKTETRITENWHDDHPLNKRETDTLKFFESLPKA